MRVWCFVPYLLIIASDQIIELNKNLNDTDQIIELNKNLNDTDFFHNGIPFKIRFVY